MFNTIPYLSTVLDEFPQKITGVSLTQAGDHLSKIHDPKLSCLLPESQAVAFHHTNAQLLFLSCIKWDIQTPVAFLTTGIKSPDEDDWGKLKRVLKYLNDMKHLKLTLSDNSLTSIKWFVDASHQTHDECKGHIRAFLTFGKGATMSSPNKQKLNT